MDKMHNLEMTQIRLKQFFDGSTDRIFETTHDPLPALKDGEVKLRVEVISIDPAMRGWTVNAPSYIPPVQPGEIMRCGGVGEVVESKSDTLKVGDWVVGMTGVATAVVLPDKGLRKIDLTMAEPKDYLSALGMPSFTAYFGLLDIGKPKKGETVLTSAASGAVGSVVAQMAKRVGARSVGIAGGPEKCKYLKEVMKLDGVIDYKNEDLREATKRECPEGVDVYFDNVGGETLDVALLRMNKFGRAVICGAISQYNNSDFRGATGPKGFLQVISKSLLIQGFTILDYGDRIPEAFKYLAEAKASGEIVFREHVIDGVDSFEDGLAMLFDGRNNGKLVVQVAQK